MRSTGRVKEIGLYLVILVTINTEIMFCTVNERNALCKCRGYHIQKYGEVVYGKKHFILIHLFDTKRQKHTASTLMKTRYRVIIENDHRFNKIFVFGVSDKTRHKPAHSRHYANMPMQYAAIFKGCKNDNCYMTKKDTFIIFLPKT